LAVGHVIFRQGDLQILKLVKLFDGGDLPIKNNKTSVFIAESIIF
jgi:hypothetical protein